MTATPDLRRAHTSKSQRYSKYCPGTPMHASTGDTPRQLKKERSFECFGTCSAIGIH